MTPESLPKGNSKMKMESIVENVAKFNAPFSNICSVQFNF